MSGMTYEDVRDKCISRGISIRSLCRHLGFNRGSFENYIKLEGTVTNDFLPLINEAIELETAYQKQSESIRQRAEGVGLKVIIPESVNRFIEKVDKDVEKWKRLNEMYFENSFSFNVKIKIPVEDSFEVKVYEV